MLLRRKNPDYQFVPSLARIVSTTTRSPRVGEVEGVDYHFISMQESHELEGRGLFAELVEFRGVRYGVTKFEMEMKMKGPLTPAVVLEPHGLKQYEKICLENGWDIFKVFVSTPEDVRIARLNERTSLDIRNALADKYETSDSMSFLRHAEAFDIAERHIARHTDRLLSITGEERHWMGSNTWNAIVDGANVSKATKELEVGVKWRNLKIKTPQPWLPISIGA